MVQNATTAPLPAPGEQIHWPTAGSPLRHVAPALAVAAFVGVLLNGEMLLNNAINLPISPATDYFIALLEKWVTFTQSTGLSAIHEQLRIFSTEIRNRGWEG